MLKSNMRQLQAYVPVDLVEKLDHYANGFGMTRSKFVVHVLKYALMNDKYLEAACKLYQVQRVLEARNSLKEESLTMFVEKAEDLFNHVDTFLKKEGIDMTDDGGKP